MDVSQPIRSDTVTDNYLTLMDDTDKITDDGKTLFHIIEIDC